MADRPSVTAMANHVERIAARRGVEVVAATRGRAWGGRTRRVALRPVRSVITYAEAMHELGHVLGRGRTAPRLEREANAWLWASRNALKGTVDHQWEGTVRRALRSYLDWAVSRTPAWSIEEGTLDGTYHLLVNTDGEPPAPGAPALPPDGHPFWALVTYGRTTP